MNRPLKFRAWDEKYNCWDSTPILWHPYEDCIKQGRTIQWFTGLTDKNGKEIYEGDILQFSDEDKGDEPCEVVYELGMFGCNIIDTSNNKDFWQLYYIVTKLKPIVIGNIFEHSKLLK